MPLYETENSDDRIPIIDTAAHVIKGNRKIYLKAGVDDYVSKPIIRKNVFEIQEKYIL